MNEAEKIAHRLLMIKDGKRALYGKLEDVKNSFGHNNVHVEFDGQLVVDRTVFDGVVQTNTAELTPAEGISPQRLLEHLVKAKVKILKFEVSNPSLDEIFIQVSKE